MGAARVRASDPLTSAYGAFGRFLNDTGLRLDQVDQVICTGVGSSFLGQEIYGIPTEKVEEFLAIGLGGKFISGLDHCIVVSMGTGTAVTAVSGEEIAQEPMLAASPGRTASGSTLTMSPARSMCVTVRPT